MRKRFDREANDCGTVQEKLLMAIVSSNQDTVFGREYNFESIQNSADFIKLVPLTTKDSYKEYVGRPCTLMSVTAATRQKTMHIPEGEAERGTPELPNGVEFSGSCEFYRVSSL